MEDNTYYHKVFPNEYEYDYDIFCEHEAHLVNQGIRFCNIQQDMSDCENCKFRKPKTIHCKVTSTSTES